MTTHQLQLASKPFNAIQSGSKTIESRLYNQKCQAIQLGDRVVFTNHDDMSATITVEVIGLLRYRTFGDMFAYNEPTKFGGPSAEWLTQQINQFYTANDQAKYGVIGVEFVVVD